MMTLPTMQRCDWANNTPLETEYHDTEWGVPVHDDRLLFEMLILEGAQSGLSWALILKKRVGYLAAFDNFEVQKIALYDEVKIHSLLQNPEIIRNKLKVNATVVNARCCIQIQKEFGSFDAYIWSFVNGQSIQNLRRVNAEVPSTSAESDILSKDLKSRGFKFIGSTTCYAFMQAAGMVNDHLETCFRNSQIKY